MMFSEFDSYLKFCRYDNTGKKLAIFHSSQFSSSVMHKVSFFTLQVWFINAQVCILFFSSSLIFPPFFCYSIHTQGCSGLFRASNCNSSVHQAHSHPELLCAALSQQLTYFYYFPAGEKLHSSISSIYNLLLSKCYISCVRSSPRECHRCKDCEVTSSHVGMKNRLKCCRHLLYSRSVWLPFIDLVKCANANIQGHPTSSLCIVVISPDNAGYQLQLLSPGQNTYSLIPRKRRDAYCHHLRLSLPSDCRTDWRGIVHSFPVQNKDVYGDIHEETQHRYSDWSVLFSLVRKWLQVRGCYFRAMMLRIVCGRRNVGSIFSKPYKPEETIPSV